MSAATMIRPSVGGHETGADGLREGRGFPFAMVGDFVVLARLSPRACQLYWMLRGHVNTARGDDRAWPGMRGLADAMGLSKIDSVIAAVRELEAIGAVDVETVPTRTGRRNVYTVHLTPPPGYTGLTSFQELYAQRARDAAQEAARTAAEAPANTPAGPPPPASRASRACPAPRRTARHSPRNGPVSAGRGGSSEKSDHPFGGSSDFSDDRSSEKSDQNQTKVNETNWGGRVRAPEPLGPADAPLPPSPRPEPQPRPRDGHGRGTGTGTAATGAGGELGAVTAQLAELTTALTSALTALATAGHNTTPAPAPAPAPTPTPAAPTEPTEPTPSAAVPEPDPARRETWRCARHLAAPDPHDRPCGGCGTVRKRMQAQEAQKATEAAQKRSEAAQHARQQIADCTECDEYSYVLDPHDPAGGSYDPPLRCHHDRPAIDRITADEQRQTAQAAAATRSPISADTRALIDATRTRLQSRTSTSTPSTTGRRQRLNPKAWR
ncbi:helix-turn-helix domain-containing protein [Pseudonocardia sp. ICBG601]|uniref:helix-turn-helix domain-containing protein n=1 Tax=Pseudonocardia sp. ICBG601 TaxID=2846759 RepID=UPI001CF719C7|nr:helix-turn-helix domain-containing protein [Pseudonocardia sp. ICBG601]